MRNSTLLVVLPLLASQALAQLPAPTPVLRAAPRATWSRVVSVPANNPTQRADNPGAASNSKFYVFGGCAGNNTSATLNDLWEFDGTNFSQITPVGAVPAERGRACVAWNRTSSKLVVFGGNGRATSVPADTFYNDIWEYDPIGNAWANVTPASGPAPTARQHSAMAWDPTTGGMVVFGGQNAAGAYLNDTWLFLSGTWVPMNPTNVPAARSQCSLATRPDFGDVFLCGGIDNTNTTAQIRYLDAWAWTGGTNWTLLNAGVTSWPGNVNANQAVYDELRQRIVMQGGQGISVSTGGVYGTDYGGSPSNFCSEFDGFTNEWTIYSRKGSNAAPLIALATEDDTTIGRISRYSAAYVPALGKVYKACGQNPGTGAGTGSNPQFVFEYQATPVAAATTYGAGCSGSAGPMTLVADTRPWSGRSLQLTGSGFPGGSLGAGVIGFGTSSTPLSALHPAGGAGCSVLVTNDAVVLLLPTAGQAILSLTLPSTPVFAGLVLNNQMLCIELVGGNITAITSTNGIAATVGAL